jgi:hypothetical protein
MDSARVPCMTYFGSMTPADDKAEAKGVNLLGRWSDIGTATGAFVCEAENYADVSAWLYNWVPMATCTVKPVCDDNTARKIILKADPTYTVDYSHVGDQPQQGETLYLIQYRFNDGCRVQGNELFANLTEEQDTADAGNCRPLGRWHDLGTGSGAAIAAATNEKDIYAWAYNWASMCECTITPVLTDSQCRSIIQGKPDYQKRLEAVKASMQ